MHNTTAITLMLALSFAGGCARTSADNIQPVEEPTQPTVVSDASRNADAPTTRSLTVSGVYLDADLASACNITTPKAFFEFDSADLNTPANDTLRDVATCLTTGPLSGRTIELVGHTDPRGTDEYNRQLGKSRAESVRDYLQIQGVPQSSLNARSVGEQGTDPNDASEWPFDRRVDIRLVAAGATGMSGSPDTGTAAGTGATGTKGTGMSGSAGTGAAGTTGTTGTGTGGTPRASGSAP